MTKDKRKSGQVGAKADGLARLSVASIAAYGAALALPTTAEAAIIYSGLQNQTVTHVTASGGVNRSPLDFDGDGQNDALLGLDLDGTYSGPFSSVFLTSRVQPYLTVRTAGQGVRAGAGQVLNLASGAAIGPANTDFANGYAFPFASNFTGSGGFAGIRFKIGGDTHYGWLRLVFDPNTPSLTAVDWAYDSTPDTAIAAGATESATPVPLPSTLPLLALGTLAMGAAGVRRKRKAKVA